MKQLALVKIMAVLNVIISGLNLDRKIIQNTPVLLQVFTSRYISILNNPFRTSINDQRPDRYQAGFVYFQQFLLLLMGVQV